MTDTRELSMNRRGLLQAGTAAAVAALLPRSLGGAAPQVQPPNIIYILSDDQTPAYLSCYGGRTPTPNLDRLAKEGALFSACYSVSPLCNPTRYTILTGMFAGRNALVLSEATEGEAYGVLQNTRLTPDLPCIADMLSKAGYFTGFVGKWHSNFEIPALTGKELPPIADLSLDDPATDKVLQERQAIFAESIRKAARFDHASHIQWGNLGLKGTAGPLQTHNVEWMTDGAFEFIDQAVARKKPFFLHLADSVPHAPNVCAILETDPRYTLGGKLAEPSKNHPPRQSIVDRLAKANLPVSSQHVAALLLDDQVAAILAKLKQIGQDQNTLVIFAQDNGQIGKGSCYRSGTHSALLMRWPAGIKAGTVVNDDVSFVDFVPTMLAAGGVTATADYRGDGVDVMPALRGQKLPRTAVFNEVGCTRSVIKGKYHYIAFRPTPSQIKAMQTGKVQAATDHWGRGAGGDNTWLLPYKPGFFDPDQLYDMQKDPLERTNLAADPAMADVLADMKKELATYLATFKTPFPMEVSPFVSTPQYAELVAARRRASEFGKFWPGYPKEDWEANINLNLKTSEEVDPTHPSSWKPRK